jgi:hypothetical protein
MEPIAGNIPFGSPTIPIFKLFFTLPKRAAPLGASSTFLGGIVVDQIAIASPRPETTHHKQQQQQYG